MAGVPSIMQAMLDERRAQAEDRACRCCRTSVRADAREGDIGSRLREIAKAHPDTIDRQLSVLGRGRRRTPISWSARATRDKLAGREGGGEGDAGQGGRNVNMAEHLVAASSLTGQGAEILGVAASLSGGGLKRAASAARKAFPVSWDEFHRDCRALAWRLAARSGPFQAIVAITRGGLVPAAIVARELGIRVIDTVCVASYESRRSRAISRC